MNLGLTVKNTGEYKPTTNVIKIVVFERKLKDIRTTLIHELKHWFIDRVLCRPFDSKLHDRVDKNNALNGGIVKC